MRRLVDALGRDLLDKVEIRAGSPVRSLRRAADWGFELESNGGTPVAVDAAVVAAPAFVAAQILRPLDAAASDLLGRIKYASVASVALLYPKASVTLPPDASGFLVPRSVTRTVSAGTLVSAKWPDNAPPEGDVVRCVVGRAGRHPALDLDDDALVERVHEDLERICAIEGSPRAAGVARWERSLPQYRVGHVQLVERIDDLLGRHRTVAVAGAGLAGSGLPDCVAQGEAAAQRIGDALDVRLQGTKT
jgi:oxygen-dependent protoporphyrinogen oxidase